MRYKYAILMAAVLVCVACAPAAEMPAAEAPTVDLEAERDALMAADREWFESRGDTDAFLTHIADDAHFMPFGAPLAQGSDAIRAVWDHLVSMPGFGLEWQATEANVAQSGDLGYTIGTFALTADHDGTAMVTVGKYVTVWSRQADGSWKVQVDCFNADGPPTAVEES